jgi:VWFA-related protein
MKHLLIALTTLFAASLAFAQTGAAPDWQTHISIPAVVSENGAHVAGLTQNDFTVTGPKGGKLTGVREVLPTVWHDKKPVVLVYDTLANPTAMQNPARTAILRYVARAASEDQPLHLIEITEKGGRIVHSAGTPLAVTMAALKKLDSESKLFDGHFDYKYDDNQAKQMAGDVTAEYNRLKAFYKEVHTTSQLHLIESQLQAFQGIGMALAQVPGRKPVIWFSSYFPLTVDQGHQRMAVLGDFTEDTPESRTLSILYEKATRLLNNGGLSVFPVLLDRSGLRLAGGQDGRDTFSGFNDFANRTGGQVVSYDTAIAPTVAQAQRECEGYYLLDYEVPQTSHIEWHGLGVKVDKNNVSLRKPDGIFTLPPQK